MRYHYCPTCGHVLVDKEAGDDGNVPYCESCQKYWFDTFSSCSIVLVYNEFNEVVVLSQNYLSTKYKTFVSGYIMPGETAEQCALREVKEEIGIELESLDYAGTYWFASKEVLMHGFIGYAKKSELKLSKEVDQAEWLVAREVGKVIFPDHPSNAAFQIYKLFLKEKNL